MRYGGDGGAIKTGRPDSNKPASIVVMLGLDRLLALRRIRAIVQGIRPFILDHLARLKLLREPRTVPIFDLGLVCRAPSGCLPRGNADFG